VNPVEHPEDYYAPLLRFVESHTADSDLARDIVQTAFLKAWERRDTLSFKAGAEAVQYRRWLRTTAKRLVIDHYRSKHTYTTDGSRNEILVGSFSSELEDHTPPGGLTWEETFRVFSMPEPDEGMDLPKKIVETIKTRLRSMKHPYYYAAQALLSGVGPAEYAQKRGVNPRTAKAHRHRCRMQVIRHLAEEGLLAG
tara:strand:- start:173 stop:760 length:588 start_codon:yes stop_codon:yes gene_type:complete